MVEKGLGEADAAAVAGSWIFGLGWYTYDNPITTRFFISHLLACTTDLFFTWFVARPGYEVVCMYFQLWPCIFTASISF